MDDSEVIGYRLNSIVGTTNHLFYPVSSDIKNVVLEVGNVGRGEAESNITHREHDIFNVGRHGVEQMVCRPHNGV